MAANTFMRCFVYQLTGKGNSCPDFALRLAGFTLVELLVAMAVAGILLSVGIPSFSEAVNEGRISSQHNKMARSLFHARSEAVKGPDQVTICPRNTKGSQVCGSTADWANGWIVFIDNTIVAGESEAKIDPQDEIIALESALKGGNTIKVIGSSSSSSTDAQEAAYIRYTIDGDTEWVSGSVIICDVNRGPNASRAINIVLTGDIRRGRISDGAASPRDAFQQPVSNHCPEPA